MTAQADAEEVRVLEARITELEIKASFAEDLVDHLNAQVAKQQEQIDALVREIAQLRKQVPEGRGDGAGSLRDELPPHY
jgi:SlyX protein